MAEVSVNQMAKFNGKNFQTWKFQMDAILKASSIQEVVKGTKKRPTDAAQVNEIAQWDKDDAKGMYLLSTAMVPEQLETLINCTTANEMWLQLISIHEQRSETNKSILMSNFYAYKMTSSDTVQHISKIQSMARALKDIGENLSDLAIITKIIGTLPSKFHFFQECLG